MVAMDSTSIDRGPDIASAGKSTWILEVRGRPTIETLNKGILFWFAGLHETPPLACLSGTEEHRSWRWFSKRCLTVWFLSNGLWKRSN